MMRSAEDLPPPVGALAAAASSTASRPRVVIVGAGFGGLSAARRLAGTPADVLLIDRSNYHLFTPLLYQVATAGIEAEEIVQPVRAILRGRRGVHFRVAEVNGVDLHRRQVRTSVGRVAYDYLILAAGSTNNFFGDAALERAALGLKDVEEALLLRNHILRQVERAAWEPRAVRRRELLSFVVVGGGPTGVEFAGALSELVHHCLTRDYPTLDMNEVKIILLEAGPRLLPTFAPRLGRAAARMLRTKRVQVRLGEAVERMEGAAVVLRSGRRIPAGTVMWAAGVRAAELADSVDAPRARAGRLAVLPTLQLAAHPEVFVVGDMAAAEQNGALLPMLAPVAMQAGERAAANVERLIRGEAAQPFHYRDRGTMATIGRSAAVAEIGPVKLSGFIAWVMWLTLHIVELIGFRNRLIVLLSWAWNYFSYDRAVRLIMGAPRLPWAGRDGGDASAAGRESGAGPRSP